MKVAILSEGKYGYRAYKNINRIFNCDFLKISYVGDLDNIIIDENLLNSLKHDIYIIYANQDVTYELIRNIKDGFVFVGIWRGDGFKKQVEKFDNVYSPRFLCEIDEEVLKDKLNKYPQLKEFLKYFGKPKVNLYVKDNKIVDIKIFRRSICGSTEAIYEFLNKEPNLKNIGLRVQHFCVAGKPNVFKNFCPKSEIAKILIDNIRVIQI
ncbi:hypothetical protein J422_06321 [Methanocaldococcus villosus KIN24-T80]|uniref:Thymidylate synthase n=1 Tax=Methanocaldococcus villosus KIN24-T80 TaxID=1069083 RepID=N6V056_9EURY|nr:DUF166 family protein [Methanocaldococcus villosus]ENN95683.1 hypothetical protein J422_06321 [Methanocaldococcus villosus KIN24-T80]